MGNINQPITRLLFNTVLPKDWGHYVDAAGVKKLLLKRDGITIPKVSGKWSVKVSDYQPGRFRAMFLEKNKYPVVPGEPYSFGYTFIKERKQPGVNNDQFFPEQVYYFGKVNGASALVNGVVADADVLAIENQILDLNLADINRVGSTAFVGLRRAYIVTDDDNDAGGGFTVTLENGTNVVFLTSTTLAAGQLGVQFNANTDVNTKLVAIRIGADRYIITSIDPGYKFTLGTCVTTTIESRKIYAQGLTLDYKIDCEFDPREATNLGAYISIINRNGASTVGGTATKCYVEGTEVSVTGHGTYANLVANFNTALNTYGSYAIAGVTDLIYIYAPASLKSFSVKLGDATLMLKSKELSPTGNFPTLTSDDVFRTFIGRGQHGDLYNRRYAKNQPVEGGIYRKYIITLTSDNETLTQSAGGMGSVVTVFELYVLLSEALATRLYDAGTTTVTGDTTPASANLSLNAMLASTY